MKSKAKLLTRLISVVTVLPALALTISCGAVVKSDRSTTKTANKAGLPDDVVKAGRLVVATGNNKVPTHYLDDSGKLVGFNVDVAAALGKRLGVKLELVTVPFDGVLAGVAAGRYDTALYNVSDTTERRATVDFVDYARSGSVVVVAKGNPRGVTTDTLSLCGLKVAVKAGQHEYKVLNAESANCRAASKPPIELQTYQDDGTMSQSLLSGRSEAMADGMTTTPYMVRRNADRFELVGELASDSDPLGMPFAKGRTELVTAFARAWQDLLDSGEYQRIADRWAVTALVPDRIGVNGGPGA